MCSASHAGMCVRLYAHPSFGVSERLCTQIPRQAFEEAQALGPLLSELMDRVGRDFDFLKDTLKAYVLHV